MPKIQNEKQSPPFRDCEEFTDEAKWKLSEIATHLSGARNDSVGGYIPVILRGGYRIGGLSPRG